MPLPPNYDARRDLQLARSICEGLLHDLDYLIQRDDAGDQFAGSLHIRSAEVLNRIKDMTGYVESAVARTPVPAIVVGYVAAKVAA